MSFNNTLSLEVCHQAIARTAIWAGKQIETADLNNPSFVALGLYKGLTSFQCAGMFAANEKLRGAVGRLITNSGDFHSQHKLSLFKAVLSHTSQRGSNLYASIFGAPLDLGRTYRNAWFCGGAHSTADFDLRDNGLNGLINSMHADLGALCHSIQVPEPLRIYDLGTNACVVNTFLNCGHIQLALKVGEFTKQLIITQNGNATEIVLATDSQGKPLDINSVQSKVAQNLYFFSTANTTQVYWLLGMALKAFASLHKATNDDQWLAPAKRILTWLERCPEEFVDSITSAKIGWGAAEMFAQTRDPVWRELAIKVAQSIVNSQTPEGIWIRPDFPSWLDQPLLVSLDTAIERMYYLHEIPRALETGGMPLDS